MIEDMFWSIVDNVFIKDFFVRFEFLSELIFIITNNGIIFSVVPYLK